MLIFVSLNAHPFHANPNYVVIKSFPGFIVHSVYCQVLIWNKKRALWLIC